jgi:hypothetical protein
MIGASTRLHATFRYFRFILLISLLAFSLSACLGDNNQEKTSPAPAATPTRPERPPRQVEQETPEPEFEPQGALNPEELQEPSDPSEISLPTELPTLETIPPQTLTPTPVLSRPFLEVTPFPSPDRAISVEDASRLIELARWGKGWLTRPAYTSSTARPWS